MELRAAGDYRGEASWHHSASRFEPSQPGCALFMKRILLPLALVIAVSAQAQITTNAKAKVDPKNNKVSNPVVEKPKPKLMSRDELRACINQQDANSKESEAIKVDQASYKANAEKLKAEKASIEAGEATLAKQVAEVKAEREGILKAHGRARRVSVYSFASSTPVWWAGIENKLTRAPRLAVWQIPAEQSQALIPLAERSMQLQISIQDGSVYVSTANASVEIHPIALKTASE